MEGTKRMRYPFHLIGLFLLLAVSAAAETRYKLRLDSSKQYFTLVRIPPQSQGQRGTVKLLNPKGDLIWSESDRFLELAVVDIDGDGIDELYETGRGYGYWSWSGNGWKECTNTKSREAWSRFVRPWRSSTGAYLKVYNPDLRAMTCHIYVSTPHTRGVQEIIIARLAEPLGNGDFNFYYTHKSGAEIKGRYRSASETVEVWDDKGWRATWAPEKPKS